MTLDEFLAEVRACPLIASAQADEHAPLDNPESIVRLALSSIKEGVKVLRLQGFDNIHAVREATATPVIGLIKRHFDGFGPYITPTIDTIKELLATPCEAIGIDGTRRKRPDGSTLKEAIALIHASGRLALVDCDVPDSVKYSIECGADIISTTLAGYTQESVKTQGPDLEFLREAIKIGRRPVLGEGRYSQRWQIETALRMGASGVVVGGALNDPLKQTQMLRPTPRVDRPVGAVDLGGTWLRFALFDPDWKLIRAEKISTPKKHAERAAWVAERAGRASISRLGISTGGTVEPNTNRVVESKDLIENHLLKALGDYAPDVPVFALNDGHASAWGHACLPQYAGKRVATLALGTGVGCGMVADNRIFMGRTGEYPRINDLPFGDGILEDVLGGFNRPATSPRDAFAAAIMCVSILREVLFADEVIVCGGVGLSTMFSPLVEKLKLHVSPFGEDAGLYGAAALALYDSWKAPA